MNTITDISAMGCAESHAAARPPQACADERMINFCPWCGKAVTEDDIRFCTRCGGMRPGTEPRYSEHVQKHESNCGYGYGPRENVKRSRAGAAAAVFILLSAGLFGAMFIGGISDLEIEYEGEEFIFINTSQGIFSGYTWTILDPNGDVITSKDTGSKSSVTWTPPDIKAENDTDITYSMRLTAHSMLGYEQTMSKEFGLRGYDVKWNSADGKEYTVKVSMHLGEYQQYAEYDFDGMNIKHARWPGEEADRKLLDIFMQTETQNHAFAKIVYQLKEQIRDAGMSDEGAVNHIAGFVQNLDGTRTYKHDWEINEQAEYWSFPLETLFEKGGDCEDLAMLMMALVRECFDGEMSTALALFMESDTEGHAMAAVGLADPPQIMPYPPAPMEKQNTREYTVDGLTYYTCETTLAGCTAGMISSEYNGRMTMLLVAS